MFRTVNIVYKVSGIFAIFFQSELLLVKSALYVVYLLHTCSSIYKHVDQACRSTYKHVDELTGHAIYLNPI